MNWLTQEPLTKFAGGTGSGAGGASPRLVPWPSAPKGAAMGQPTKKTACFQQHLWKLKPEKKPAAALLTWPHAGKRRKNFKKEHSSPSDAFLKSAQPQVSTGSSLSASSRRHSIWLWLPPLATVEDVEASSKLIQMSTLDHCSPDTGGAGGLGWRPQGIPFAKSGGIRVSKAETFDARSFYLIHDMLETVHKDKIPAPEPRQVALLLPLLAAEKTCQVMLYRNKFLGPNFRPSRMWHRAEKKTPRATPASAK